jgi:hypothetical protein
MQNEPVAWSFDALGLEDLVSDRLWWWRLFSQFLSSSSTATLKLYGWRQRFRTRYYRQWAGA